MTTDATPQQETPSPAPQPNQNGAESNSSRPKQSFRRRRKRRGSGGNPSQGAQNGQQGNGAAPAAPQNNAPRNENHSRKKKRFFKKNQSQGQSQQNARGARGDSRGNNNGNGGGNGQQRRGSKQRKPKVFVGPMDHSYRTVNGNFADGPPSTIELQRGFTNAHYNGNGNGNYNPEGNGSSNGGSAIEEMRASANQAAAENSPIRIYCFIDDLFFIAKIQETARKLGIKVAFVKNEKDTVADMLALPEEERPRLIVFDLNNANAKPLTLIPKLKAKLKRATSVVGFLSHLQGELKAKAIEAGCDTVMPRSAFSQTLPNLLRRYGIEVEVEDERQPEIIEA